MAARTVVVVVALSTRGLLALVLRRRTGRLGGLLLAAGLGLRLLRALFLLRLGGCLGVCVVVVSRSAMAPYIPAVGNLVPDFTPTRTLLSPSTTFLVRVPLFVLSSNSCTFEMWIVPSLSTMPPCGFFCDGLGVALDHRDLLDDHAVAERREGPCRSCPCWSRLMTTTVSPLRTCGHYSTSGASG